MNAEVREILHRYFAEELGRSLQLPDSKSIADQRSAFLSRFGPDQLARLTGPDMLAEIPDNATRKQSMYFWLILKEDSEFSSVLFGEIPDDSGAEFGVQQQKRSKVWRTMPQGAKWRDTTHDDAARFVDNRRIEMIDAASAVSAFKGSALSDIDAQAFQATIEAAAPTFHSSRFLHKYLHMVHPELVTCHATATDLQSALYNLGDSELCEGLFALDIQLIQLWNSIDSLSTVPIELRYRLGTGFPPRTHWALGTEGNVPTCKRMISGNRIALGPDIVGNLNEIVDPNKKTSRRISVQTAMRNASLDPNSTEARNLVELLSLKEGHIVSLFPNTKEAVAVGIVNGSYEFAHGSNHPHQVPVEWIHTRPVQVSKRIADLGSSLIQLDRLEPAIASISASLLTAGFGPNTWRNFRSYGVKSPTTRSSAPADRPSSPLQAPSPPRLEGITAEVSGMLDRKRQVILYGPPGTGKTYHAARIALEIVCRHNFGCRPEAISSDHRDLTYGASGIDPYIATCTFHPMYSYEDFIEGYRPDRSGFALCPGIFKRMATVASAHLEKRFVLIIDEINRGNIPRIFGELLTLIDAPNRGKTHVSLPLSKQVFTVPDNLLLIGTMNTADRSIVLLDTALRRRFAFKELLPDTSLLNESSILSIPLGTWLRALNRRIIEQLGRDGRNLQIGHAYLMPNGRPAATIQRIGEVVRDEIWPLLQEYCYEDPNKLANILGTQKHSLYDRESANLKFELFEPANEDKLARALASMVTAEDKQRDAELVEDQQKHQSGTDPNDSEIPNP